MQYAKNAQHHFLFCFHLPDTSGEKYFSLYQSPQEIVSVVLILSSLLSPYIFVIVNFSIRPHIFPVKKRLFGYCYLDISLYFAYDTI